MALPHSQLRSFLWLVIVSGMFGVLMASCESTYDRNQMAAGDPSGRGDPSSLSAGAERGKQLFEKVGCLGCHTVHGQGGKVGPDLSNEGNAGLSRQWLSTQIRDPKKNDPQSIMPAFGNLSDQQVKDLVDYLESLKTGQARADTSDAVAPQEAGGGPAAAVGTASPVTTGGNLWGQICGQCHNLRAPSEYSDAQWAVAVHHMRVRVPLTGEEQRDILAFLQASN
jgi:mono/diheme cytochrome c family protein